ncbi:MAG: sialate O-acetylesterase, partial [Verrucomicrobiae bacterium]|nr:sialate O-acetylesterase [Verrucomicrobiae bacterium]
KTLSLVPHTGMAIAIDIGDPINVHPKNKQEVGRRLARWAKRDHYGDKDIEVSGPIYESNAVESGRLRVKFTHLGGGLMAKDGELKGFAIAGADKVFRWANAEIDGDTVVVWSDQIAEPRFVRYAWANNPECTLYNGAGLPAVPFRTDEDP